MFGYGGKEVHFSCRTLSKQGERNCRSDLVLLLGVLRGPVCGLGTCGTEPAAVTSAVGHLPAIATINSQLAYTISSFFLAEVS